MPPRYLASDLDGTLIPPVLDADRRRDIDEFTRRTEAGGLDLTYVTGRHLALATDGIGAAGLPWPARIFCDVGTSLHVRAGDGYVRDEAFRHAMAATLGETLMAGVRRLLDDVEGLALQEPSKQAEFKLSYYVRGPAREAAGREVRRRLAPVRHRIEIISSEDPASGDGLLDLLPEAAGKRHALDWLCRTSGLAREDVLFAGDSGNDRDALLSGHPAVLVGNAPDSLRTDLARVAGHAGLGDRLYFARAPFAAGVVEGAEHFGFL
jgi:HAD superfamily hydrolase (TIGR01484 family)